MQRVAFASLGLLALLSGLGSTTAVSDDRYRDESERWRQKREADLKADDGWLTVSGLYWLRPGESRIGSDPANDLLLPARTPGLVGTLDLAEGKAVFRAAAGVTVTLKYEPARTDRSAGESGRSSP